MGKISDKEFVDILGSDALLGQKDGCYKNVRTESLIDLIRDNFKSNVDLFYNGVALKTDIPQSDKGWWFASEKGEYLNFANVMIGENNLPVITPIVNNADLSIISIDKDGRYQIKTIVQSFADSYNALTQQYIQQYINSLAEVQADLQDATKILYNDDTLAVDIIKRVDKNTGNDVNYRETTTWYDGSPMTDAKVDNIAFLKRGGKYYKIQMAKFDIRYFGIVNSPTLDQSAKLDAMALYADYNDVYEIDFHGFDILTSKTVVYKSYRDSHHSGLTFREAHKIKNLRISHDMTVQLIQGNKLIQFIPKYNPETEKVFALDNVTFNPYNPNYTILSGEADGYMFGFGAFVEPETWNRPSGTQEQSNWSFNFRNIVFESPAISYNIATADIFAKNIYCENMSGQHWGLYYFFIGKDNTFKNCKSFFRRDLHSAASRVLVTSVLHIETEIGVNGVINVNTLNIDNCECLNFTNDGLGLTFKHHNIGEHIFENVNVLNSNGVVEFFAEDINKTTVKNINVYNHGRGGVNINVKLYNLYANKGWFEPKDILVRGGRNEEIQNFVIENCNVNGAWGGFGGGINEINNMIVKDCKVIEPDLVFGLFRNPNIRITNLKFINHKNKGNRLFEASVKNLFIDGMESETNVLSNFILLEATNFTTESDIYINGLKFANTSQEQNSNLFTFSGGLTVNAKEFTNSFTANRLDLNFDFEANVFPVMKGTTAQRPSVNNIGKMYFNTESGSYEIYNGGSWIKMINNATINETGIVKKSAAVLDVTSPNAVDLGTALTLINEIKTKLNSKFAADRDSGQQI